MPVNAADVKRLAGLELNALRAADALPEDVFENARVAARGTVIHDLNGEPLFHRVPLSRGKEQVGFVDVAANEEMGHPLVAISRGADWDEKAILEQAIAAARKKRRNLRYDTVSFVRIQLPQGGRPVPPRD